MPTWDGATSTSWSTATNWDADVMPGAGDTVLITGAGFQPLLDINSASLALTSISAGTLTIGAVLTSTSVTLSGGGILTVNAGNSIVGNVTHGGAAVVNNGTITGTASITSASSVFNNAGVITGATTISAGTLNINAGSNLSNSAAFTVNGGTVNVNESEEVGSLGGTGGTVDVDAGQTLTFGGSGFNSTYAGAISGGGALVKAGGATTTLTGANTHTGNVAINAGAIAVTGAGSLASTTVNVGTAGALTTDGDALADSATLTVDGDWFVTGSETIGGLRGANTGVVDLIGGAVLTTGSAGFDTFNGNITGSGGLIKQSSGFLDLWGINTYTGTTTLNAGVLGLWSGVAIVDSGAVVVNGGTLQVFGNETIGSLAGSGGVVDIETIFGSINFTVGDGSDTSFAGTVLETGSTNTATLTKTGTGTMTLSGAVTLDVVNVTAGKLSLTSAGNGIASTTVQSGATLTGLATGGAVTVVSGGKWSPAAGAGSISSGSVSLAAGAALVMDAASGTVGGYDRLDVSGTVTLGGATLDFSTIGGFSPTSSDTFVIINNDGIDAVSGVFSGLAEGTEFLVGDQLYKISYLGGSGNDVTLRLVNQSPYGINLSSTIVTENNAPDAVVATLTASDPNTAASGFAGPFTYALVAGPGDTDNAAFSIVGDQLRINGRADFETKASYSVRIEVTDAGGLTFNGSTTITVSNVSPEIITGTVNPDNLIGGSDIDHIFGLDGADVLDGRGGADDMSGGIGNDVYYVDNLGDIVREAAGSANGTQDTVITSVNFRLDTTTTAQGVEHVGVVGTGNVTVVGSATFNVINGNSGNNYLAGYGGNDTIDGKGGDDLVFGGEGKDTLTGGTGNDRFYYNFIAESGGTQPRRDVITDFSQVALTNDDWIDLAATDANGAVAGNQAFTWLGTGAFTGAAGELRYFQDVANNRTIIEGNVRVDAASPGPEFSIELTGLKTLTAGATNAFDIIL